MQQILKCPAVMIGFALAGLPVHAGTLPSFMGLGNLPGGPDYSVAHAVSGDGSAVIGTSMSARVGSGTDLEPFRWTSSGGMTGLGSLAGAGNIGGSANGVSADGSVVVGWSRIGSATEQAFKWTTGGGMISLGTLPGGVPGSNAFGTSSDGSVIVGQATAADGAQEPMRWTQSGGMVSLGRLSLNLGGLASAVSSDGSVVVGHSGSMAFQWTQAEGMVPLGDLSGGANHSDALDITGDGSIVVGYGTVSSGSRAAQWSSLAGWAALPDLFGGTGYESIARAISADGSVVVGQSYRGDPNLDGIATLWSSQGIRAIQDILGDDLSLDLTGWSLISATGISDDGVTITGWGYNPNGLVEAWRAVLPEPEALLLLLIGAGTVRRRARRRDRGIRRAHHFNR
jgi:probable HAF family extracellular repeat protein